MPVDKFGRTDVRSKVERIVSGGVTLSKIIQSDINLGSYKLFNVKDPTDNQDAATKNYVDRTTTAVANDKVLKRGDTMTSNLLFRFDDDHLRMLGCNEMVENKSFHIYLGNERNQIKCQLNNPILIQTTEGLLLRQTGQTRSDIIRFGKETDDPRTDVYQDVVMNQHFIADLHEPHNQQDAATKNYVDSTVLTAHRKNMSGYIPALESNPSCTGFVITASSSANGKPAYKTFNNQEAECWVTSRNSISGWPQIKCPERVAVWRIALKARNIDPRNITAWSFAGSNSDDMFTTILTSTDVLEGSATAPSFFNITTSDAYQYYRLIITASTGSNDVGVQLMQLYVYDM